MRILKHIQTEAKKNRLLYANPVVAMDAIAGQSRAQRLESIASEIRGLDDVQALKYLVAIRDDLKMASDSSMSLIFSLSEKSWFEGVVDLVARENKGWIEISSSGYDGRSKRSLFLPQYRRMLGLNHSVAYITRQRDESPEEWSFRRSEWLGNYHPEVKVIHAKKRWDKGRDREIFIGTVDTFTAQIHTVEADLISVRGLRFLDGSEFDIVDVFMNPATEALATVRQTSGEPRPLGLMEFPGRYHVEVVA